MVSDVSFYAPVNQIETNLYPRRNFAVMIAGVVGGGVENEHAAEDGRPRVDLPRGLPDGELQQLPKAFFIQVSNIRHPRLQIRFGRTEFL